MTSSDPRYDAAIDEWNAQDAIEKAKIAEEHGFKPWGGFAPTAPSKTAPVSKEEQARPEKELQAWLNEGLPKKATETIAAGQSPVACGGLDDVLQSIKNEYCTEVPEPTGQPEPSRERLCQ